MSVSSTTNRVAYSGNGSTTTFSFPYIFLAASDLVVIVRNTTTGAETTKVLNTDYTVTGAGIPSGGSITMVSAPASGNTISIIRNAAPTQTLDLGDNDALPAESLESGLDRLALAVQRALDKAERAIRLSDGFSGTFDPTFPGVITAGYIPKINDAGTALEFLDPSELTGPPGPAGADGAQGDPGPAGADGADGADGAPGADGKTLRYGTTAPSNGLGNDGDFYIDTVANMVYGPKASGTWPAGTSIKGADGTNGTNGTNGQGVPTGGTANQVLAKINGTDYNTQWVNAGTGDVAGPASSVDSELVLFSGTGGKTIKRDSGNGYVKTTSGVVSHTSTIPLNEGGTGQTTKAAAFDALSPMTTSGDIIYGGASGTGTRLPKGTDGQVLTLASGVPSWVSAAPTFSVASKTTTYTLTNSDDVILLDASGGGFTLTLHDPTTATKKLYTLKKTDSSVNKITIGGYNLEGSSRKICTQYESVQIYPDGTNWQVFNHKNTSDIVSYTPTFTGFGTATSINFTSCRVGSFLHVEGTFTTGTTTGVEAQVTIGFNGTSANVTTLSTLPTISNAGVFNYGTSSASSFYITKEASKTYVTFSRQDVSSSSLNKLLGTNFGNSTVISVNFKVPIVDWW